ncbi:hypothetical protein B0J11DRAFT_96698 [Dendryphion nanum]|uniref:Peptide hydrolase n=1 Tax=Dendryphion nanum TaxID=256645 RepID=A0A9P9DFG4_9PLEO|nr:hypothetical protein B0J11DRAFT_96698 [Dendryphion nanum]
MKTSIVLGFFATAAYASTGGGSQYDKCRHKPIVNSKKLQHSIGERALIKGAQALQKQAFAYPARNRLMGTAGHNDTVKYIVKELEALDGYYKIELQKFSALVQLNGTASLSINGVETTPGQFDYSPSGNTTAPLAVVSNLGCVASDYPSSLTGKVALISRGSCEFGLKSVLAGNAGATAAILYDNQPGGPLTGTLGTPPRPEGEYIPTLGLSQEQGIQLRDSINGGANVTVKLNVLTDIQVQTTNNVIATSNCGNPNSTIVLGAHTDSVAAGPGINDDGSGTIGILEVAKQLAKYKVNHAVRFGFWSGEEEGLLGSTYYVEHASPSDLAGIRLYLNFDMIASPNYIHAIYDGDGSAFNATGPAGSAEIESFFEKYFASVGQNSTATAFDGRSDYAAFIDAGIPAGGTFTGAEEIKTPEEAVLFGGTAGQALDPNYHAAGDTVENLSAQAFVLHTRAAAAAVAKYAVSLEGFPVRGAGSAKGRRGLGMRVKRRQVHVHGGTCKKRRA